MVKSWSVYLWMSWVRSEHLLLDLWTVLSHDVNKNWKWKFLNRTQQRNNIHSLLVMHAEWNSFNIFFLCYCLQVGFISLLQCIFMTIYKAITRYYFSLHVSIDGFNHLIAFKANHLLSACSVPLSPAGQIHFVSPLPPSFRPNTSCLRRSAFKVELFWLPA